MIKPIKGVNNRETPPKIIEKFMESRTKHSQ